MAQKEIEYDGGTRTVSYDIVGIEHDRSIVILHGWGSNKELMKQALSPYLKGLKQIYIDMPGFGKSPNDTVLTTSDYAKIIGAFLEAIGQDPVAVIGHSFGGKVATLLDPPLLVLLSSSGILVPKPFGVRAKITLFKLLKPLGARRLRRLFVSDDAKGMSEAMYETFKNVVDEDFSSFFAGYEGKALLFWGKNDTATPLWTGEKIASLMADAHLFPLEGDHYFFLDRHNGELIGRTIAQKAKELT